MITNPTKKEIKEASLNHAKEVLGIEQFNKNKDAVKSISSDFTAGIDWLLDFKTKNDN